MIQQIQSRAAGESCAQASLVRLLCAVSIWRTIMTRMLPLCGTAAWWTALICLLPGVAAALLLRLTMRLTQTNTLMEAIRACLGRTGMVIASIVLAALLLCDGASTLTVLMTFFTEGVGTRGTQLTLAILTGVLLLCSLHREGLPRAVHFLRWLMAAAAVLTAVFLLEKASVDHLFPLYGEGQSAMMAALKAGWSLSWPLVLLTAGHVHGRSRLQSGIVPIFGAVAAVLLLTLAVPHSQLVLHTSLARVMLLPVRFVPNAVRVIAQSLIMLAFFFSIGAAAQLAASSLCMPLRKHPGWLPYVLVGALVFTQAADVSALWTSLGRIEPWLLVPLLVLVVLCLPAARLRRKNR